MNKKAMLFAFLFIFVGFLGMTAQLKDHEMIRLEKEAMRIQAEAVTSGYVIYVDVAIGDDVKGEGTAKKPYKTINRALDAAGSGDTIKVGPGVYSENLTIDTLDRIALEGSGSDSSIINGWLYVSGCKYLRIKGFKSTAAEWNVGLQCDNTDVAVIQDSVFATPNGRGILLMHNSAMWVYNSQFNCGSEGWGVQSHSASYLWLENCTISGNGYGIAANRNGLAYVSNCTISNNWMGVLLSGGELFMQTSSFFGNSTGIKAELGGRINANRGGDSNKIYGNTEYGVVLSSGSIADLSCMDIYDNPTGISAGAASILYLRGNQNYIHNNDVGIYVGDFAHGILRNTPISGNGVDVSIHDGGQAICSPELIGSISSDCPYCQQITGSF